MSLKCLRCLCTPLQWSCSPEAWSYFPPGSTRTSSGRCVAALGPTGRGTAPSVGPPSSPSSPTRCRPSVHSCRITFIAAEERPRTYTVRSTSSGRFTHIWPVYDRCDVERHLVWCIVYRVSLKTPTRCVYGMTVVYCSTGRPIYKRGIGIECVWKRYIISIYGNIEKNSLFAGRVLFVQALVGYDHETIISVGSLRVTRRKISC